MKDEELAEEYADRTRIVDENTRAGTDCISLVQDYEGNVIDIHERIKQAFLAGLKAGRPQWHELGWEKDFPEADKLIRVRLRDGMEHICETCYYEPTEDEIGYGKLIINFYELNGEWVDDTEIIAWCEIPAFDKE